METGGIGQVVTPWSFRDGREYIVSMSVAEKPKSMAILISDKITAEEWTCHYDLKYIEDLTQRTGNYKPFDTFVTMIKAAILKNSSAVALELMSYEDLKAIKTRRHLAGLVVTNSVLGGNSEVGSLRDPNLPLSLSKRKYLIVTYVAQFDNVHYPVPLHYSGPPDPIVMQNNIKRLQAEVSQLRSANLALSGKVAEELSGNWEPDGYAAQFEQTKKRRAESREGMDLDQMSRLLSSIQKLEQKIVSERTEHLDQMEKLQAENGYLRDKIHELQVSEQLLSKQISRLETRVNNSSASREGSRKPCLPASGGTTYEPKNKSRAVLKPISYAEPRARSILRNGSKDGRSRPCSTGSDRGRSNAVSTAFQPRGSLPKPRSRSASPAPRFDATAYIRDKKRRQEELNRIRLDEIKANFLRAGRRERRSVSRGRSGSVHFVSDYESEEAGDGRRGRSGLRSRSASQSPPRNTEARLALRRLKTASSEEESLGRGRSIERRGSARKAPKSLIKRRTKSKEVFVQTSLSDIGGKTASTEVMVSDQEGNKLRQAPSTGTSKTYLFKDLESSLDALQAFINTKNQAHLSH